MSEKKLNLCGHGRGCFSWLPAVSLPSVVVFGAVVVVAAVVAVVADVVAVVLSAVN